MPTQTLVSEEEYLHTSYEPDCEYLDGELVERITGTPSHSELIVLLSAYFVRRRKQWGIRVYTDVRTRIRAGRYRLPDIAVVAGEKSTGNALTEPPLIWIEIWSPEDRPVRMKRKVQELLEFGVPYIWVIDPETLESEVHTRQGSTILEDGVLRIPNTGIEVPLQGLEED
jgi:Uma2 family endonuclease